MTKSQIVLLYVLPGAYNIHFPYLSLVLEGRPGREQFAQNLRTEVAVYSTL